jgi:hypothetical protein
VDDDNLFSYGAITGNVLNVMLVSEVLPMNIAHTFVRFSILLVDLVVSIRGRYYESDSLWTIERLVDKVSRRTHSVTVSSQSCHDLC